jgi:hypothetical protein
MPDFVKKRVVFFCDSAARETTGFYIFFICENRLDARIQAEPGGSWPPPDRTATTATGIRTIAPSATTRPTDSPATTICGYAGGSIKSRIPLTISILPGRIGDFDIIPYGKQLLFRVSWHVSLTNPKKHVGSHPSWNGAKSKTKRNQ